MSRLIRVLALCSAVCCLPVAAQELPPTGSMPRGAASTRTVSGSVVLRGAPVSTIRVTIMSSARTFQRTIYADSSGSFSVGGVPVGNYLFEIESEGYRLLREQVEIPPGSGVFPVQFMLNPMPVTPTPIPREPSVSLATLNVPDHARREYEAGHREMERRHWKEAREHFEKALAVHAKFPQALHELARIDLNDKLMDKALERLQQSVTMDPSFFEGHLLISFVLSDLGRNQDALGAAERAAALRPADWRGHYQHGMAALFLGLIGVAQQDSDRIEGLEGARAPDIRLLRAGVLLKLGRGAEAREQLTAFLKEAPNHRHAALARQTLQSLEAERSGVTPK